MISQSSNSPEEDYLIRLKEAKFVRAVTKGEFSEFFSVIPDDTYVFAYEGPDDKCVYYHWINRLTPMLKYEPYVCKNKFKVLQLYDAFQADLSGVKERIRYFVDRDFDCLQGRADDESIFVTDRYSIENYLVESNVLDDVLKIDFHCDGYPTVRAKIVSLFRDLYGKFLSITEDLNFFIYVIRRLGIRQFSDFPNRLNQIAIVELDAVKAVEASPHQIISVERYPSGEEMEQFRKEFKGLQGEKDYRGKFALLFFVRWLDLLRRDRCAVESVYFYEIGKSDFSINGAFGLQMFAARSSPPPHLHKFLLSVAGTP